MEYSGLPADWIGSHGELASNQDYEKPFVQFETIRFQKLEAFDTVAEGDVINGGDKKRQTGDILTWIYYGKSIGSLHIVLALALVITTVFAVNFQGTKLATTVQLL